MKMEFKSSGLMSPKVIARAFAALLIFTLHVSSAFGQGTTAFTYQGQLLNNGANVNGTNVMVFTLYSSPTGNTAIATPITNGVFVSNGLFTVDLNFGAAAFKGNACWLDIAVSNDVTNVDLSPRTQVLPTPYATYAASAAFASSAGSASNLVGGSVVTGSFVGNGSGLTDVGVSLQMEAFPNPGTFTFIAPTNVSSIIVEAWGGGGCGGSGSSTSDTAGGGGGGGGYAKGMVNVTPGAGYSVIVGTGGTGGGSGGTSSFGVSLIIASGGVPGGNGSSAELTPGGAGGTGSGSSSLLNIKGGAGQFGNIDFGGGNGGNAGAGGPGGLGNVGTGSTVGNAPGGGGGGGPFTGGVGSAGGNGEVIVYY
jgi:hypothetical protein